MSIANAPEILFALCFALPFDTTNQTLYACDFHTIHKEINQSNRPNSCFCANDISPKLYSREQFVGESADVSQNPPPNGRHPKDTSKPHQVSRVRKRYEKKQSKYRASRAIVVIIAFCAGICTKRKRLQEHHGENEAPEHGHGALHSDANLCLSTVPAPTNDCIR